MIEFSYAINSQPVDRLLAGFEEALGEQRMALERIAADAREMIARQFATEGRAGGTPWPELAASTLRRRGTRAPILYSSGALLRSLLGPGAEGHVEERDEQSLTLGSRLPYALFHQTGTRRMPARPMIVLSGGRVEKWTEMVRQEIEAKTLLLGARELGGKE